MTVLTESKLTLNFLTEHNKTVLGNNIHFTLTLGRFQRSSVWIKLEKSILDTKCIDLWKEINISLINHEIYVNVSCANKFLS